MRRKRTNPSPIGSFRKNEASSFLNSLCVPARCCCATPAELLDSGDSLCDFTRCAGGGTGCRRTGDEKVDVAMVVWLIRGGGHTILFDSGFHRDTFRKDFPMQDYLRPDQAVETAGVKPDEVTDVVISHAHWDHMGGIDLFPKATIWIQREEYRYYTGDAWQPGGDHGGIDADDVKELVKLNTEGRVHLVDGDNQEIFPGIRAYTGSRHTFSSQYLRVDGAPPYVLASDNVYFYLSLKSRLASATFSDADHAANIAAQARMFTLAGSPDRVVPGHDMLQFQKFPTEGRVATIR
jgi:glyoxylase-like metal-dependent hydrolase (beta-lactamase superfamily II)